MRALLALVLLAPLLTACPKQLPPPVAGTDEERVDQCAAKLEELRTRAKAQEPSCDDWCQMASQACSLRAEVCEIASRHADRAQMQTRCAEGQEDCAHFTDGCDRCRR